MTPEIVRTLFDLTAALPRDYQRIRIAVTIDELAALSRYLAPTQGYVALSFRGIPLQVEENPTNPTIMILEPKP